MTLNEIILAGGTGCLDPALYDHNVAGLCAADLEPEAPQPAFWRAGTVDVIAVLEAMR